MLSNTILERIASDVEEDVFFALKEIIELKKISPDEANALAPLLVPYLKSNNPILNTYAKSALNSLKGFHPALEIPSAYFDSSIPFSAFEGSGEKQPPPLSQAVKPIFPSSISGENEKNMNTLFCEIAIELGFINKGQAESALLSQRVDAEIGQKKPIGAYLHGEKILNKEQIEKILLLQDSRRLVPLKLASKSALLLAQSIKDFISRCISVLGSFSSKVLQWAQKKLEERQNANAFRNELETACQNPAKKGQEQNTSVSFMQKKVVLFLKLVKTNAVSMLPNKLVAYNKPIIASIFLITLFSIYLISSKIISHKAEPLPGKFSNNTRGAQNGENESESAGLYSNENLEKIRLGLDASENSGKEALLKLDFKTLFAMGKDGNEQAKNLLKCKASLELLYRDMGIEIGKRNEGTDVIEQAKSGDPEAINKVALHLSKKGLESEAFICYQIAAEKDFPQAQLTLGMIYYNGVTVPKDNILATKWIILASFGLQRKYEEEENFALKMGLGTIAKIANTKFKEIFYSISDEEKREAIFNVLAHSKNFPGKYGNYFSGVEKKLLGH